MSNPKPPALGSIVAVVILIALAGAVVGVQSYIDQRVVQMADDEGFTK